MRAGGEGWRPACMPYSRRQFDSLLRLRLSPRRYEHSLHVESAALHLAALHGVETYHAAMAGLMHDVCHDDSPHWQRRYLRACGVELEPAWEAHPQIWHALTGSVFLRRELGVRSRPILNAVRYHTTGRAAMSGVEKVVFLADLVSLDREYDGVEALRDLCAKSLDEGMRHALEYSVGRVLAGGTPLVRDAWEAYNDYVARPLAGKD